ncbi:hypothetical protein [Geodermatophilus sp. SYSU D01176]
MDVLNPSPAYCVPQAMWLTYRVIMEHPDLSQTQILDFVTPETMRPRTPGNGAHATRALAALREFGLVCVGGDGLYQADKLADSAEFIRVLRYRLLAPPETFGADFEGAPSLRLGLIWLMRQAPFVPLDWGYVQTVNRTQLFTNDTRFNAFRPWSIALGMGMPALGAMVEGAKQKATGEKVVPDPTQAVIDVIKHPVTGHIPRGERIPIQQLLEFLRAELPVLPGHPSANYDGIAGDPDNGLRAVGLALTSAEARGILTMTYQSDPSGVIALPDAQDAGRDRYVSALTIKELAP